MLHFQISTQLHVISWFSSSHAFDRPLSPSIIHFLFIYGTRKATEAWMCYLVHYVGRRGQGQEWVGEARRRGLWQGNANASNFLESLIIIKVKQTNLCNKIIIIKYSTITYFIGMKLHCVAPASFISLQYNCQLENENQFPTNSYNKSLPWNNSG